MKKIGFFSMKRIFVFIIIYATFYIGILCHELSHSFLAYFFSIKANPFNIHYVANPLLLGIHENVNYAKAALLPGWQAVLISAAGPLMNLLLTLVSFFAIVLYSQLMSPWLALVFYCFYFWNTNEWFNYTVIRNLYMQGDMAHIVQFGFPHWLMIAFGIPTSLFFVYMLFTKITSLLFSVFKLDAAAKRQILSTVILVFIITQGVTLYNNFFMYRN